MLKDGPTVWVVQKGGCGTVMGAKNSFERFCSRCGEIVVIIVKVGCFVSREVGN